MPQTNRLPAAYAQAKADLLSERVSGGHWIGELATSALSTATAVSALSLMLKAGDNADGSAATAQKRDKLQKLIDGGVQYLSRHQNPDGGWGDTDKSFSNIATTMLVVAAMHLAGRAAEFDLLLTGARNYIHACGGIPGLRNRYGKDKTFAVPILTNYALAGLVDWSEVSPLPFELACLPQSFYRFVRLPVVSYAIPALVAIGQARYFHKKPWNPLMRWLRAAAVGRSLQVLRRIQPSSGGYLEAVPLTSFVVMSLAATGRAAHPVTESGTQFLLESVRPDGSWPIDTNLATWTTTLAINALSQCDSNFLSPDEPIDALLDWLLKCQNLERHPFTGADPGGWGWSDLSGAVPDADDTPGALLALHILRKHPRCSTADQKRIEKAAELGLTWLLGLQNRDGGWPTFCRGWGTLPFDRSGSDLTAHAIRALHAWREFAQDLASPILKSSPIAIQRGFSYLAKQQRADGSWIPLWFGNQCYPGEENPVYGTAKVLAAYRDTGCSGSPEARRGISWLVQHQNLDGGWGNGAENATTCPQNADEERREFDQQRSGVEETALAVEAVLGGSLENLPQTAITQGLDWLIRSVETRLHHECSPIGFYFAKLWYYEKLYPLTFTVSALGLAMKMSALTSPRQTATSPAATQ